jgi:hypothetical protein
MLLVCPAGLLKEVFAGGAATGTLGDFILGAATVAGTVLAAMQPAAAGNTDRVVS